MIKRNKIVLFQIIILVIGFSSIFHKLSLDPGNLSKNDLLKFENIKMMMSKTVENQCQFFKKYIGTSRSVSLSLNKDRILGTHSKILLDKELFLSVLNLTVNSYEKYPFSIYVYHNNNFDNFKCYGKLI